MSYSKKQKRKTNPRFDEEYRFRRRSKFYDIVYQLLRTLNRLSPVFKKLEALYAKVHGRPLGSIIEIDSTSDDCLHRLVIDLKKFLDMPPIEYIFYTSAQESPIRPYQLEQKHQRMMKWAKNFEAPYPVDRFMAMILEKLTHAQIERAEKGEGPLKKSNIHGVEALTHRGISILNVKKSRKVIINYVKKRLKALLEKHKGIPMKQKKALLAILLKEILKAFGIELPYIDEEVERRLEQAVEKPTIVIPESYTPRDTLDEELHGALDMNH